MCFTTDPRIPLTGSRSTRPGKHVRRHHSQPRPRRSRARAGLELRPVVLRAVQRHGAKQREQDGVTMHLQAELNALLQRDGDETRDRTSAKPPRGGRRLIGAAAQVDLAEKEQQTQRRRHGDEQSAFREQLQIVVVGLAEELVEIVPLIEAGRDRVGIEACACETEGRPDVS